MLGSFNVFTQINVNVFTQIYMFSFLSHVQ